MRVEVIMLLLSYILTSIVSYTQIACNYALACSYITIILYSSILLFFITVRHAIIIVSQAIQTFKGRWEMCL